MEETSGKQTTISHKFRSYLVNVKLFIMHTNLSKISNVIEWTILILVIILIIHGIFNPIESETLTKDTYLINSNSSLSINDYSQQQQNLLNAVHEHLSYAVQNNISRENLRMQGGLFL